jgi:TRAP-type C4-dicarboxylate transport system substrate-binding protein
MNAKKKLCGLLAVLMVFGMLGFCWAAEKTITWKWANYVPRTDVDPQAITQQWFADEFERRTRGKYKIKIYWGGTLARIKEIPWAVRDGLGDIGDLITPYFPDHFLLNDVGGFVVPMRLSTIELGKAMFVLHEKYPQFQEEFKKYNMKCIGFRPLESYGILSNKPLRTAEDMKGLKIRSLGAGWVPFIKAMGSIPVSIATPEMYEAMERGVLEASPIGITLANRWKVDRIAKYFTYPIGAIMGHCLIVNLKSYNKLPPDVQAILMGLGQEYLVQWAKILEIQIEKVKQMWKGKMGVEIIPFPQDVLAKVAASEGVKAIHKDWVNRAKERGVTDGDKIIDMFKP